jgi:hypothetical protein
VDRDLYAGVFRVLKSGTDKVKYLRIRALPGSLQLVQNSRNAIETFQLLYPFFQLGIQFLPPEFRLLQFLDSLSGQCHIR